MNLPNKLTTVRLIFVPLFVVIYLFPFQTLGVTIPTFEILSTQLSLLDIILFFIFFSFIRTRLLQSPHDLSLHSAWGWSPATTI